MDYEMLNRLMVHITYEIRDFLPANIFHPIGNTLKINDRKLSEEQARGFIASGQAENILYAPPKNQFMSLRQRDACELLIHLGHLIGTDPKDPKQQQVSADFHASLKKYFYGHLSEQEKGLFISLLKPKQEESQPKQTEESQTKQTGRYEQRKNEVLRIIRDELKLDPLKLPHINPGKPWVKSQVKSKLSLPNALFTSNSFDDTWEEMRRSGEIKEK